MTRKTIANMLLIVAILFVLALALMPAAALATDKPPPSPVAPSKASADASAAAAAKSVATAAGTASVGDVAPSQSLGIGGDTARAWSLALAPPAFTPPMAAIAGCAPRITQQSTAVTLIASHASAETDPTDCTLILLRNAKVDQCQYATAKQVEDRMLSKLLPGFTASAVAMLDLTPSECAMVKAPPRVETVQTVVNYIATPPAADPVACKPVPTPSGKKKAAAKPAAACKVTR